MYALKGMAAGDWNRGGLTKTEEYPSAAIEVHGGLKARRRRRRRKRIPGCFQPGALARGNCKHVP